MGRLGGITFGRWGNSLSGCAQNKQEQLEDIAGVIGISRPDSIIPAISRECSDTMPE